MKHCRYLIAAVALFLLAGLSACHQKHGDSLAYLDQYVGQKPGAGLWSSEPLHTKLKDLTGDRYDQFVQYMQQAEPLTSNGKYLYTLAPIAKDSTRGYAFILVNTKTGKLAASIHTTVEIENFQSPGEAFEVPEPIRSQLDSLK